MSDADVARLAVELHESRIEHYHDHGDIYTRLTEMEARLATLTATAEEQVTLANEAAEVARENAVMAEEAATVAEEIAASVEETPAEESGIERIEEEELEESPVADSTPKLVHPLFRRFG